MAGFTKGKWEITECAVQTYGEPIQHFFISPKSGEFSGRTIADIGLWRDFPEDMVRANAHLIAAAPDMYKALKELMGKFETAAVMADLSPENINKELSRADKALAKAEGK